MSNLYRSQGKLNHNKAKQFYVMLWMGYPDALLRDTQPPRWNGGPFLLPDQPQCIKLRSQLNSLKTIMYMIANLIWYNEIIIKFVNKRLKESIDCADAIYS